jgi:uncharacterized protein YaiE (UPF0345 family)
MQSQAKESAYRSGKLSRLLELSKLETCQGMKGSIKCCLEGHDSWAQYCSGSGNTIVFGDEFWRI